LELTINLPSGPQRLAVTGPQERNLKIIREALGVTIWARNGSLRVSGDSRSVGQAVRVLEMLQDAAKRNRPMNRQELLDAISSIGHRMALAQPHDDGDTAMSAVPVELTPDLDVYARGRQIRAMTPGQRLYIEAILSHDLTFCIGPAGTGKTYLAVAAAVAMFKAGQVRKLVLVRPAVEAGEKLGFLPGDLQQKVNPYLRPLLDALHDMMEFDQIQRFMASDLIEVVPLAYMRGRTLNDALIILDEGQNTTKGQMLMFLTRLGHRSKMIVTGDTTQIDLEKPTESGLIDAARRLLRVPGIAFVTLEKGDIVRHNLVQRVVDAYAQPARAGGAERALREAARKGTGESPDADKSADVIMPQSESPADVPGQP
jgi:phosphate starvation-inducible PhoH-like protein